MSFEFMKMPGLDETYDFFAQIFLAPAFCTAMDQFLTVVHVVAEHIHYPMKDCAEMESVVSMCIAEFIKHLAIFTPQKPVLFFLCYPT